jgi:hypothetical protein
MSKLIVLIWILVSILAASYAGQYVGKRFLRGRISAAWALILSTILGLVFIAGVLLLQIPFEYVLWVYVFIGSTAAVVWQDPYGIHAWLEKNADTGKTKEEEKGS